MTALTQTYLSYGVPQSFAKTLEEKGISKTTFDNTPKKILIEVHELDPIQVNLAKQLIKRKPIDDQVMQQLMENSSFCCCLCKTPTPFIIHHIIDHAATQDNSYENLAILCLLHHDEAHKQGKNLTRKILPEYIRIAKANWENEVKKHNEEIAKSHSKLRQQNEATFNYSKYSITKSGAYNEDINVSISLNTTFILKVEQQDTKQEFVVYLSVKTDLNEQKWIGFAIVGSINNRVYRDSEHVFRIGRSGENNYKIIENIMDVINESGLDFKGIPTSIDIIRFRGLDDTLIDFYYEFKES